MLPVWKDKKATTPAKDPYHIGQLYFKVIYLFIND